LVSAIPQGQRVLTACSGKNLEQAVIVPTARAALHGDAVSLRMPASAAKDTDAIATLLIRRIRIKRRVVND
jgi:hypothetical protein